MSQVRKIRPRESIFLKILFVFIAAGAANIGIMRVFEHNVLSNETRRMHRSENMAEYGKLLTRNLPQPPTAEDLASLAERLHLRIRVETTDKILTTDSSLPSGSMMAEKMTPRFTSPEASTGRLGDSYVIQVRGPSSALWSYLLENESDLDSHPSLILLPVFALLFILTASYFLIRHILAPLREIEHGVREVARGNLQPNLRSRSPDELGRLTESFNRMTEQVHTMMTAKEKLLLDVSHEFRSPLTRIKVAMELKGEEGRDSVLRSVRDLETMLSELLESARLDDPQGGLRKSLTDVGGMLHELAEIYEDQKPGVRVESSRSSDLFLMVDPARLQIALRNLVENALKFSAHQSHPVELRWEIRTSLFLLHVRDHGVGISAEDQTLIFEPFYRVDRSRMKSTGGYGLGLSLARKIIEAHGGRLTVQSGMGGGSEFTIELPRQTSGSDDIARTR